MSIHLAFYQPDIPQNVGAAMRLAVCLGCPLHIIMPTGFIWKDQEFRRSGLDYIARIDLHKHMSWHAFLEATQGQRKLLMTTKAALPYCDIDYKDGDILLLGRESAGVPEDVHATANKRLLIPMVAGERSINVVNSAALVLGEALRQTNNFPKG